MIIEGLTRLSNSPDHIQSESSKQVQFMEAPPYNKQDRIHHQQPGARHHRYTPQVTVQSQVWSMIIFQACRNDNLICGVLRPGRYSKLFVTFLSQLLSSFCGVAAHIVLLKGSRSSGYVWLDGLCQVTCLDPWFPGRLLHCSKIICVGHFNCQWF